MNLGNIYGDNFDDNNRREGGYEKVLYYYKKGEQAAREGKDTVKLVGALASLSRTYASIEAKQAIKYGLESLQFARLVNDYCALVEGHDSYARALLTSNRIEEALSHSNEAVKYALLAEDISYYFLSNYTLAEVLGAKKDYKKQVQVLEKTLEECEGGISIHQMHCSASVNYYLFWRVVDNPCPHNQDTTGGSHHWYV